MIHTARGAAAALLALLLSTPALGACSTGAFDHPAGGTASPAAASAASSQHKRLSLPRPTGSYATGRDTLQLTDRTRRDPWVPSAGPRRLMVSLFYPARKGDGEGEGGRGRYMSAEEAGLLLKERKLGAYFTAGQVASTRTHARTGARPARGRHPLVLLSPGFTLHRATLTGLAEELASHGYVVALVDHAYESSGTTFPGGGGAKTLPCVACETVEKEPDDAAEKKRLARAARDRAADLSVVVDELTGRRKGDRPSGHDWSALVDPRRIGAAGHSLGGNAAAVAAGEDHRIRAAANLDGSFFAPVPRAGSTRPVLMLGTRKSHTPQAQDATWPRQWMRLHGWKRWLTVKDAGHFSFTDLPVLGDRIGVSDPSAPLSGKRSGQITTRYVTAFFDQQLSGRHRELLEGPTEENPEVAFHNGGRP